MGKGKNALLPKQKRIRINNEGKPASVHADVSFEFLNHYGIMNAKILQLRCKEAFIES